MPRYAINRRERHVADFLDCQRNIATEHCGSVSPVNIDEYIDHDGFRALIKAVHELNSDKVISEIEASGLRGEGAQGFPHI
jgi:NADH:ubiquinone oxidoreductase subunit F (NADH-binding)